MAPQPNPDKLQRKRAQRLDELMRSNRRQLWWRARRFTVTDQDADDALEDACIAFLRFFRLEPEGNAASWMMTTVKHAALAITERNAVLRRRNAAPEAPNEIDEWWESMVRDPRASPEEQVEAREWFTTRIDLLAELKPDERTAVALVAAGYSYREVSERQGWTPRKVNRCVAEGRARLRELLSLRGDRS